MKEHIFEYNFKRTFLKSILTWIYITCQLVFSIYVLKDFNERTLTALIIINVFFSMVSIPGIILHINYLKHTKNVKLTLRYNSISHTTTQKETILNTFDICKIILHEVPTSYKLIWWDYSWFELIDTNGKSVKVSHYLLDIGDFWQDSLTRRVNSNNLIRIKSAMPLIK